MYRKNTYQLRIAVNYMKNGEWTEWDDTRGLYSIHSSTLQKDLKQIHYNVYIVKSGG